MNYVWVAEYCPISYESQFGLIGAFSTRRLARGAMKEHKRKELTRYGQKRKKQTWEYWRVRKVTINFFQIY